MTPARFAGLLLQLELLLGVIYLFRLEELHGLSRILPLIGIGFAIHVGELDTPYQRNEVAARWSKQLATLQTDPWSYRHVVEIHAGKGHWMDGQDAKAIPWLAGFTRTPRPAHVAWKQDDVTHTRFYWLGVPEEQAEAGDEIIATIDGQQIRIETDDVAEVVVRLNDALVNTDEPVSIMHGERELFSGVIPRTIGAMAKSLAERGDPDLAFAAEHMVKLAD